MRTVSWPGTLVEPFNPMGEALPTLPSESGSSSEVPDPIEQRYRSTGRDHSYWSERPPAARSWHGAGPFYIGLTCDLRRVNPLCLTVTLLRKGVVTYIPLPPSYIFTPVPRVPWKVEV